MSRAAAAIALSVLAVVGLASRNTVQGQEDRRPDRLPLQKHAAPFESPETRPKTWTMRYRTDPQTGREIEYDPKPRIVPIDPHGGWYGLIWIGADGQEKVIRYQRPDAIDIIVRADVRSGAGGRLQYVYTVDSLSTSGQELTGFEVQTLADDAKPITDADVQLARMGDGLLGAGHWWRFRVGRDFTKPLRPGDTGMFTVESRAPPGLVECAVDGGARGMKGVGEEPPDEFWTLLVGYKGWPRGHTIGPIDRLRTLSSAQKTAQLLEWLPEFRRLGWMTMEARGRYDAIARERGLAALADALGPDLAAERITPEVAAVVRGLAGR